MSRSYALCFAMLAGISSFLAPQTVQAAESYDNCTGFITALPAVITTQGTWCMNQDLVTQITSGSAIEIKTNNVTIDCNDFKLGNGSANPSTVAKGIYALNRLNTVVRNCNIRRFAIGLHLEGGSSGGHQVEGNRFDGNTGYGIWLAGDGSVIRGNRVFDTGGTHPAYDYTIGIYTDSSVDIIDNIVSGVVANTAGGANGEAYGIYTSNNLNGRVVGNGVRGLLKAGIYSSYGIYNSGSGRISLHGNDVFGLTDPGSIGLRCTVTGTNSAKDNFVSGFATGLDGCADDGNVVRP